MTDGHKEADGLDRCNVCDKLLEYHEGVRHNHLDWCDECYKKYEDEWRAKPTRS